MALTVMQNLKYTGAVVGACNLVGFGITSIFETHKITDLVGVGAFVAASTSLLMKNKISPFLNLRAALLNGAVIIWGTRLSSFLFYRVLKLGEDKRLDQFFRKPGENFLDPSKSFFPINLLSFWSIQAAWGFVCMLPVTLVTALPVAKMGVWSILPTAGLVLGLILEGVADWQKYKYKQKNKDHWCDEGLWALARHPNYFGELTVWWSIYALSLPVLGAKYGLLGLASPGFVSFLLLCLSGIPMLEKAHEKKYGNEDAFKAYKQSTNLLFPLPWKLFADKKVREL